MRLSDGRGVVIALALAALLSASGLFNHSLWPTDEPRVAQIGRAMFESGDWVVPRLGQRPFLEMPPLYWWVMSLGYKAFGVSDATARIPSAVFLFFTLMTVFFMARGISGWPAGLVSMSALSCFVGFHRARYCVVDPALAFFVCLAYAGFQRLIEEANDKEMPGEIRHSLIVFIYIAAGFSFLSKGVVGPLLIFGPIAGVIVLQGRWIFLKSPAHIAGLLILAALVCVWPILLYQRGGEELFDGFVVKNILHRADYSDHGPIAGGHKHHALYYLKVLPGGLLPWILAFPAMLLSLSRGELSRFKQSRVLRALLWIALLGVLLLSIPGTKRSAYLLPLYPPLAVVLGVWMSQWRELGDRAANAERDPYPWIEVTTQQVFFWGSACGLLVSSVLLLFSVLVLWLVPDAVFLTEVLPPPGVLLLTAAAAAIVLWICIRRGGRSALLRSTMLMVLTLLAGYLELGVRVVDRFKNPHPLVHGLKQRNVFQGAFQSWRCSDEFTVSILLFDADFEGDLIDDQALIDYLRDNPGAKILTHKNNHQFIPEAVSGSLHIIWSVGFAGRHQYHLLQHRPDLDHRSKDSEQAQDSKVKGPEALKDKGAGPG